MSFKKLGILGCISLASIVGNVGMNSICLANDNNDEENDINNENRGVQYSDNVFGLEDVEWPENNQVLTELSKKKDKVVDTLVTTKKGCWLKDATNTLARYTQAYLAYTYSQKPEKIVAKKIDVEDKICAKSDLEKVVNKVNEGIICACTQEEWDFVEEYAKAVGQYVKDREFRSDRIRPAMTVTVGENENAQQIDLSPIYIGWWAEKEDTKLDNNELNEDDMSIIKAAVSTEVSKLIALADGLVSKDNYLQDIALLKNNYNTLLGKIQNLKKDVSKLGTNVQDFGGQLTTLNEELKNSGNNYNKINLPGPSSNKIVFKEPTAESRIGSSSSNFLGNAIPESDVPRAIREKERKEKGIILENNTNENVIEENSISQNSQTQPQEKKNKYLGVRVRADHGDKDNSQMQGQGINLRKYKKK